MHVILIKCSILKKVFVSSMFCTYQTEDVIQRDYVTVSSCLKQTNSLDLIFKKKFRISKYSTVWTCVLKTATSFEPVTGFECEKCNKQPKQMPLFSRGSLNEVSSVKCFICGPKSGAIFCVVDANFKWEYI